MSFKMVPVPADLVFDVMRFVLAREDEELARRYQERLARFLAEDDFTRSLLVLVATQTLAGQPSRARDVAAELGTDDRTVIGAVRTMNAGAAEAGLERVLRMRKDTFVTADGSHWNSIVVTMTPDLAARVAALTAEADESS
jgi:KaiC/GvpD/RAD55 family RecA-like ATPase